MTVSSIENTISYDGDDVTVNFTTRQFLVNDDIKATLRDSVGVETLWIEGSDYTLVGAGDPNGGTLTASVAPATGESLNIKTDPSPTQETAYPEGGPFPAKAHETALDKGALVDQNILEILGRALTVPVTDEATSLELPIDVDRAGKVLIFDSNGNTTVISSVELFTKTVFISSVDSPYTVDDDDAGAIIRVDTSGGPVTIDFSDATLLATPEGDFGAISIGNQDNIVTLMAAVGGQLRSQNGTAEWTATTDPIYGGTSDGSNGAGSDEAEIRIKRFGGLWVLNGDLREEAVENREILTRKSLILQGVETGPYTFVQDDHAEAKIFTGGGAENWTVPVLSQGTTLVVHNIGAGTITFVASGVTLIGLVSLGPNNSASLSWLTSGTTVKLTGELS